MAQDHPFGQSTTELLISLQQIKVEPNSPASNSSAPVTTQALGEESGRTTLAVGEEGGDTTSPDTTITTLAIGEEGGATTLALGEEGGISEPIEKNMGNLGPIQIFEDWVGSSDRYDYYQFNLLENSIVKFNLSGLEGCTYIYTYEKGNNKAICPGQFSVNDFFLSLFYLISYFNLLVTLSNLQL